MTTESPEDGASAQITARIEELGDWRGAMLGRLRALVRRAVPQATEAMKWRGTPVWEHHGILCTGETYKEVVKATFAKGAFLPDPAGLFNSSLEGNLRRAIDFREGDRVDEKALVALVRAAAELNAGGKKAAKTAGRAKTARAAKPAGAAKTARAAKPAGAAKTARAAKAASAKKAAGKKAR